ncbi:hypothetical protein THTE_0899 [Thermogutta terrifontis]|uniref:Uncharacterized protein n=1 Tax=Thermogutta terrifontis TaxID=1331910 RepID=A0A286RC05_9BACT|nr:hypothetical protein THTE_0899 [Thermogutta terrifontis]
MNKRLESGTSRKKRGRTDRSRRSDEKSGPDGLVSFKNWRTTLLVEKDGISNRLSTATLVLL